MMRRPHSNSYGSPWSKRDRERMTAFDFIITYACWPQWGMSATFFRTAVRRIALDGWLFFG
jgi:hypothetical protein